MNQLIISIDLGTTGCRTVIFNELGDPLSHSYQEYNSIYLSSRWIDHDPKTWLEAAQSTVKEAISKLKETHKNFSAIAVTSQRATVIPVDKDGDPIDNAILWQDKRAIEETEHLKNIYGSKEIYTITGLRIDPYFTLPKLLWFKKNRREIYGKTFKFLTVQDFIIHYLTGIFKTDWTQASRTMLFNIDRFKWEEDLIKSVGIALDKLPEAVPPGSVIGVLNRSAADKLGLPEGIPVIAAGGDQQCAAIGLGVVKDGLVEANTGTGSFVLTNSNKPFKDKNQRLICSASSVAGKWVLEAGIFTTGSIYRWFRDNFWLLGSEEQKKFRTDAYSFMNSEAEKEPIGSNGLLLIPHFAASAAPYWNPEARGILFGLSLGHTSSSIIRAILEGIAFEIRKNMVIMEGFVGPIKEVRISGGLTRSEIFNQIQADIYGRPVVKSGYEDASSLGAAIIAAVKIGLYNNIVTAVDSMTKLDYLSQKNPIDIHTKVYEDLIIIHDELYKSIEKSGIYHKLNEVVKSL
ncbi:MAG TPA: carbohydrate kinase [Candidatus Atribacteria bacterium]|nr:carbohydrate kinase [Candidatus Atribacteria bacterium]